MEENGRVIGIKGNIAEVEIIRTASCKNCCGCSLGADNKRIILANNGLGAKIGDYVTLELPADKVIKAAAAVYVIPLLLLILGIYLGNRFFEGMSDLARQGMSAFVGLFLFICAFIGIHYFDRKISPDSYRVKISSIRQN